MGYAALQDDFAGDSTLVTLFVDTNVKPDPAGEGFVRVQSYSVNRQAGPLSWIALGPKTLTVKEGGTASGGRCLLGVCGPSPEEKLSAVVSFYRAPETPSGPESPFDLPATLRFDAPLACTNEIVAPDGSTLFFYPLIANRLPGGKWTGEPFKHPGNYFYTVCVRKQGTTDFYICDPEMEIGP